MKLDTRFYIIFLSIIQIINGPMQFYIFGTTFRLTEAYETTAEDYLYVFNSLASMIVCPILVSVPLGLLYVRREFRENTEILLPRFVLVLLSISLVLSISMINSPVNYLGVDYYPAFPRLIRLHTMVIWVLMIDGIAHFLINKHRRSVLSLSILFSVLDVLLASILERAVVIGLFMQCCTLILILWLVRNSNTS
ncbi:MAG: hypothetical protein INQ03_04980 [Candidatus Heimdallarchaeota archaeon]|nr:hypothetical protein [Candidatus Heimdallarchaeota archaeon]